MDILLTSVIVVLLSLLACRQAFINKRILRTDEARSEKIPYVLLATTLVLVINMLVGGQIFVRLPCILLLGLTSLCILSFSFISYNVITYVLIFLLIIGGILVLLLLLAASGAVNHSSRLFAAFCPFICMTVFVVFALGIWLHLRNLKNVMRSGSIWANVTLGVDAIYAVIPVVITMFYISSMMLFPNCNELTGGIFSVFYFFVIMALGWRFLNESLFVFWTEHERIIVESMRISHIDAAPDNSGSALLYKSIYERILEHFNDEKPYLNSSLTINDVVAVAFSNKLYISKAINRYTGRNFCQFVNYHRVIYAVELFRKNPKIKIADLASQSGFNSAVSFGMAFNLFMGEKPGDWCRRERHRLDKLEKLKK